MKNTRKRIPVVLLLLLSMIVCLGEPSIAKADRIKAAVTAVQFTQSKVTVAKGSSKTLTANILPASSNYLTVTFLSDSSVVELKRKSNNQVTVTGKKAGTATITAIARATGSSVDVKATCKVTVVDSGSSKISLPGSATVYVGSSKSIKDSSKITPNNAKVTWKSSDASIATVNTNGRVYGKKEGKVKITATMTGTNLKDTCIVTVKKKEITIPSSATVYVGSSKSLKSDTKTVPKGTAITWKSSNKSIATVNTNGRVYGHREGSVQITATVSGEVRDVCTITVKKKKINISLTNTTVYVDSSKSLKDFTTTTPKGTAITWKSSNKSIATVNTNGRVYGHAEGTVVIEATVSGNVKDTCKITVKEKTIKLSSSQFSIPVGNSKKLTATTLPTSAEVIWESSDETVAIVDGSGRVTGVGEGMATITAYLSGTDKKVSCKVTVTNETGEASILLSPKKKTLHVDSEGGVDSYQLEATVFNAVDEALEWKVSNPKIATVDQNGLVTAKSEGTTTVTATLVENPAVTAKTSIVVGRYELSNTEFANAFYHTWQGVVDGMIVTNQVTSFAMLVNEDKSEDPMWHYKILKREKMADKSIWIYAKVYRPLEEDGEDTRYGLSKIAPDRKSMKVTYSEDQGETYKGRTEEFKRIK